MECWLLQGFCQLRTHPLFGHPLSEAEKYSHHLFATPYTSRFSPRIQVFERYKIQLKPGHLSCWDSSSNGGKVCVGHLSSCPNSSRATCSSATDSTSSPWRIDESTTFHQQNHVNQWGNFTSMWWQTSRLLQRLFLHIVVGRPQDKITTIMPQSSHSHFKCSYFFLDVILIKLQLFTRATLLDVWSRRTKLN